MVKTKSPSSLCTRDVAQPSRILPTPCTLLALTRFSLQMANIFGHEVVCMNDTHVDPYYLEDYVSLFDLYKLSLTPPTEARPCGRNGADFNWTCVPEAEVGTDHGPPMTLTHFCSPHI